MLIKTIFELPKTANLDICFCWIYIKRFIVTQTTPRHSFPPNHLQLRRASLTECFYIIFTLVRRQGELKSNVLKNALTGGQYAPHVFPRYFEAWTELSVLVVLMVDAFLVYGILIEIDLLDNRNASIWSPFRKTIIHILTLIFGIFECFIRFLRQ